MLLAGLQRCSLIDYPGHTASVVFTQGCNLRCPFCHNGDLVGPRCANPVPEATLWEHLERRRGVVDAVVVSGGEPTEHADLINFLRQLRERVQHIKLDTNGTRPDALKDILDAGLVDYVAMDVKAPPARLEALAGRDWPMESYQQSIGLLRESGVEHEFRTTVVAGEHVPEDIEGIARWIAGGQRYFLQPFRPEHALKPAWRDYSPPTPAFMESCRRRADRWLPCRVR